MMKAIYKMFDQRHACPADIRIGEAAVKLGMCNKCMKQLFFFFVIVLQVKVQQVIDAQAMCACHEAIHRYISLQ